ncbi:hypothetical protein AVEN_78304-1 [Araneus ventricosus]|uniref:Uncharacterized protein n=1 Tax=Araneus ventricosus TaxID=182803 RepID=A0A4Y2UZ04_ARAVE|nr:hypothetical protein AVEN_78304-1 [Araneus ventricosus]
MLTKTDDDATFTGAMVTGLVMKSEMVSSVGEFTTLSHRTTVLRQSFRLDLLRAVSCSTLRSGIFPSRELKAVEVSYARACLTHRISPLASPLTLSDIETRLLDQNSKIRPNLLKNKAKKGQI